MQQVRDAHAGVFQVFRPFLALQYAVRQLFRRRAAQARNMISQRPGEPFRRQPVQSVIQFLPGQRPRVQFVLRGRRQIGHPGLDLAHPAHFRVHVPDRFQDPVLLVQHQATEYMVS